MSQIELHLDFETFSRCDLKTRGLDNYLADPSTEILMLAFAVNEALPQMWFPQEGPMPDQLRLMLERPEISKHAFNCEFEREVLDRLLHIKTPIRVWRDAMVMARYASIPGDLDFVGHVLRLPLDEAKMKEGTKLISLFCKPHTTKKKGTFRNTKETHPEQWAAFVEYCKRDVIAERLIAEKLKAFTLPEQERKLYELDQAINQRGMPVGMDFVRKASVIVAEEQAELMTLARAATGCENPNSRDQMLAYLKTQGYQYGGLGARWVNKSLAETDLTAAGRTALELRKKLAKSSTAKLEALANFVSADGRLRNQYVYMGAARTNRWSGRGVQLQNLPRATVRDIPGATAAILTGNRAEVAKFGSVLEVIASCLRSAFRAS